ncbi:MAG: hypothetical protein IKU45_03320 [Clostridia bacterium]|nr:hypothetical protein [Clostridia bacterium]
MVWIYTFITALVAVLATVFNLILEKYYVEAGSGMYKSGTVTPEAFAVFMAVGVVVIIVSSIIFGKENMPKGVYGLTLVTAIASLAAAFVLAYSAVSFLMSFDLNTFSAASIVNKTRVIGAFVAFPAAVYYFISFLAGKTTEKIQAVFSFFPLVWTWIYLLGIYFDHTIEMSSPARIIKELALITLMLYQLMETRALIGKSKPRAYLMVSSFALIFLCPAFLPKVFEWIGGDIILDTEVLCALFGAIMVVYIFARLIGFAIVCSDIKKKEKKHKPGDIFSEEEEEAVDSEEIFEEEQLEETENDEESEENKEDEESAKIGEDEENTEVEETEETAETEEDETEDK